MNYKEAFARYGVRLTTNYHMSGVAPNGDIVLALWEHLFRKGQEPQTLEIEEDFSGWKAGGPRNEFVKLIKLAQAEHRPVRLIVVTQKVATDVATVAQTGNVKDASPREHLVGEIITASDSFYKMVFRRST